jgi:hypothetical protein
MDRDLDRIYGGKEQGVAPTQNTDAFGTSKEMGGGIGGGQKDLLGKKADMADPNRPDIQAEMEQEMEDQLSGTGTDFEDAEGLALAFETVKKRYANDPQRLAALEKLEAKNPNASPAKGSATNPMTSATEGIKPVGGKASNKEYRQNILNEIDDLSMDETNDDTFANPTRAGEVLFREKYKNDEQAKEAIVDLFAKSQAQRDIKQYEKSRRFNPDVIEGNVEALQQKADENLKELQARIKPGSPEEFMQRVSYAKSKYGWDDLIKRASKNRQ